jgi:hypothetical protein
VTLRISASILLLALSPGLSQTAVKDPRLPVLSDERMRSVLSGMGFEVTEDASGEGTVFSFPAAGHTVRVVNLGKGFSVSACFQGAFEPMKANQWNRQHFSTRTQRGEEGCALLESDVTFGGGSTNQEIGEFVRQFCTNVVIFDRFVAKPPADSTARLPVGAGRKPGDGLAAPIAAMGWSQAEPFAKRATTEPHTTSPAPGHLTINAKVSLKYDASRWKVAGRRSERQLLLSDASGRGHALVIWEPMAVPIDAVEDLALANAQSADPQATVVFRHRRWVNGVAYWFLKMEATVETIPTVYWGYFHVSEGGTVQVVAYTEKSRLPEYEQAFTEFLNGVTFTK